MVQVRKPAAERKKQIVDEAMRLAAELGPDRMTTQKLADAVGVSQAAIFRHFPSKTEIWQAVSARINTAMPANIVFSDSAALDRLRAVVKRQFGFIVKTPAIPAILYSRELHAENETLRSEFAGMIDKRHALFTSMFATGIESGEIDPTINPKDAASLVLATIQGLAMRWSLEQQGFDLVEEGVRLLDLQFKGYTAR